MVASLVTLRCRGPRGPCLKRASERASERVSERTVCDNAAVPWSPHCGSCCDIRGRLSTREVVTRVQKILSGKAKKI